jgi:hypothetical protein
MKHIEKNLETLHTNFSYNDVVIDLFKIVEETRNQSNATELGMIKGLYETRHIIDSLNSGPAPLLPLNGTIELKYSSRNATIN